MAWADEEDTRIFPTCDDCGEEIDDFLYDIGDELLCYECMDNRYKHDVDKYVRDRRYE